MTCSIPTTVPFSSLLTGVSLSRKKFDEIGASGIIWPKLHVYSQGHCAVKGSRGVLRGSVLKCLTRNPRVLDSSRTGSSGFFFVGVSLGMTLQSPSLVLVQPRKDMNNLNCRRDMTEILLKAA